MHACLDVRARPRSLASCSAVYHRTWFNFGIIVVLYVAEVRRMLRVNMFATFREDFISCSQVKVYLHPLA